MVNYSAGNFGFLVGPKNIMFSKIEFPETSFSKQLQKNEIIFIYFPCLPFSMLFLSISHGRILYSICTKLSIVGPSNGTLLSSVANSKNTSFR